MKQLSLIKKPNIFYGGSLRPQLLGQRKLARPLSTKKSIHLVLKAESFNSPISANSVLHKVDNKTNKKINLRNSSAILNTLITKYSKLFSIKIYNVSIQHDHIHLVIKIFSNDNYKKFIRSLTGMIARTLKIKWLVLPFTRIVEWSKAFKALLMYVEQNELEALGIVAYQKRKNWYGKELGQRKTVRESSLVH